jgi:hypothetical protein
MEADEVAWKGLKGIGKGLKGGAQGALKVAEKTSMAVLETKDKIEDLEKVGAKGPKKHKVHLDSDARAEMKARAAAANTKPEIEDLGPDQSGMSLLGGLAEKAKATTVAVAAKTQETAQMATSKTMEAGETLKKAAGVDDASAARERAAVRSRRRTPQTDLLSALDSPSPNTDVCGEQGGGQEIKFDEDGNPIIPEAPSKGVVGGLVGGVVGTTTGLVGGVVGTTLEVGHMTGEGLKKAVGVDDKDAARQRAAVRKHPAPSTALSNHITVPHTRARSWLTR